MPIGSGGIVEIFLPAGGTAGQAIVKIDGVDYNFTFGAGGGGGAIASLSAGGVDATGARIVFSNSNNVSFGAVGNTITATVAAGAGMAISAGTQSNNTGTVVFSNSNNVTFGMTNSSIVTASFSQSVQTQASGNIAGSGFTSGGAGIGLSGTHNSAGLSLSATVPVQTNQSAGIYASSQTFGQSSSSTHDARSLTVVGSGGVSVGWSNSSLLISGQTTVAQSNQSAGIYASSQTFGQSSSSTHDARSLTVVGSGGVSVGWSNSSLLISGQTTTPQTNQSAIRAFGASNTGNTAGNTGVSTGIDWVLAGSNNITISESTAGGGPNTLWVSGPTAAAQTNQSLGIYGSSQTYGQSSSSTYDARSLSIVGSGGVSVGWSNSSLLISGTTYPAQSNQSAIKGLGASNTGNTAGNTGISSGIDWVIAGSNNITISESTVGGGPNTLWVSGPTVGGAQTGISGIQVSDTTYTSGTVTWRNANGISFGSSGANGITASYTVPTQTNQTAGVYASSQTFGQSSSSTYDARSLSLVGSGNVSVGWSNSSLLISATQTVQTQASGAIAGSGVTTAGNNIGLSGTLNSLGLSISATVAAAVAQTNQTLGIYASSQTFGQSSSSTYDARSLSVVGSGGISVGWSNSSLLISGQTTAAQTNQTGGIYITAQSTGQSSSSTYDMRTLSMVGDGIVSIGWSNSTLRVSATQSNQAFSAAGGVSAFQTLGFSDNANASFTNTNGSVGIASVRASLYATSNTTQSSTGTANLNSLIFAGAGIASVGISGGSVVISVPTGGGAGDGGVFAGVSTGGNTAGSTGTVSTGNFVLVGTGAITLSQSTGAAGSAATVTLSVPQTSSLVGTNGISIATVGSTISVSAQQFTGSWWQPEVFGNTMTTTFANNTVYFRPLEPANYLNVNKLIMQVSGSSSATTASFSASVSAGNASSGTGSWGHSGTVLLFSRFNTNSTHASYNNLQTFDSHTYSFGAGYSASVSWSTNASSATASVSTSGAVSWIASINQTGGITTSATTSSTTTSFSSTSTNANSFSSSFILSFPYAHLSGFRPVFVPMSGTTLSPGEYWMGLQVSTNSGSTNMSLQRVAMMGSVHYLVFTALTNNYMEIGNSVAVTSSNYRLGFGSHSNTSGTTTTMGLTAISTNASNMSLWFALDGKSLP